MDAPDGQLAELRRLLGIHGDGGARERIDEHEAQHVAAVGRDLPAAIRARTAQDDELGDAMVTPVERALSLSIARDPSPVVDALAPLIGQLIRKAVANAMIALNESFNNALAASLSPASLAWRLEAWRTGHPFAEVALLKSLVYRVEQVFVIHRETGLVLQHAVLPAVQAQDADMISGMLTAIQDFVRDSFNDGAAGEVDLMKVGELQVWVERSPHMAFAAVIRGHAPAALRSRQQDVLNELERRHGAQMNPWNGDAAPFEASRELVEPCLETQQRPKAPPSKWPARVALALIAVAIAAVVVHRCTPEAIPVVAAPVDPWAPYLGRIVHLPGVVVVDVHTDGDKLMITGLRDPLAPDPAGLLAEAGLTPAQVVATWLPFASLAPEFVVLRANRALRPPAGVHLQFTAGILKISGAAPRTWIDPIKNIAPAIAGVEVVDTAELVDTTAAQWPAAVAAVDAARVDFAVNQVEVVDISAARTALAALDRLAEELGRDITVTLVAHRDRPGDRPLQRTRLLAVDAALRGGWRRVQVVFDLGAITADTAPPGREVSLHVAN